MKKIFFAALLIIATGSVFAQNTFVSKNAFLDTIAAPNLILKTADTTNRKMLVVDASGNFFKSNYPSSGISGITADNGLTASTSTNVQLGGTLLQNTTIDAGSSYNLLITGSQTGSVTTGVLNVTNTAVSGGNAAIYATSSNWTAIRAEGARSGILAISNGFAPAIDAQSTNGVGVSAQSTNTLGLEVYTNPSSNNTVEIVARLNRGVTSSAAGANGIGGSLDFYVANTSGSANEANRLISKWADATDATRTSQFIITGVSSATTNNLLTLDGDGTATFIGNVHLNNSGSLYIQSTNSYSTGGWGNVVWNVNTGRAEVTNGSILAMNNTAIDVTLTAGQYTMLVTATGKTVTLPTAVGVTGTVYVVKLTAAGSATVATTSSQTIDGSTTYSLASQNKYVTVQSDGSNWVVIGNN